MAILAVCAAYPQGFQSVFDFFNPFNYLYLFTGPPRNQKPADSSSTAAASTTAATNNTG